MRYSDDTLCHHFCGPTETANTVCCGEAFRYGHRLWEWMRCRSKAHDSVKRHIYNYSDSATTRTSFSSRSISEKSCRQSQITVSELTWIIRFGSLFLFAFLWLQWAVPVLPVLVVELIPFLNLCPDSMENAFSIYECYFCSCIFRIEFVISPNLWWYRFGSILSP